VSSFVVSCVNSLKLHGNKVAKSPRQQLPKGLLSSSLLEAPAQMACHKFQPQNVSQHARSNSAPYTICKWNYQAHPEAKSNALGAPDLLGRSGRNRVHIPYPGPTSDRKIWTSTSANTACKYRPKTEPASGGELKTEMLAESNGSG